jgi:hypothetical protein
MWLVAPATAIARMARDIRPRRDRRAARTERELPAAESVTLADLPEAGIARLEQEVVVEDRRRLTRVVAMLFDAYLDQTASRHARAI